MDLSRALPRLQRDLSPAAETLRYLRHNLPCVVQTTTNPQIAEVNRSALAAAGCLVTCEPAVSIPRTSLVLSVRHERSIKKEISKAQRARTNLMLMFVRIDGSAVPDAVLPSLLALREEQFDTHLRDSDTVLVLDEARLIVLGFATDQAGAEVVERKALQELTGLLGPETPIRLGFSLYPDDAQSMEELLLVASNRKQAAATTPLGRSLDAERPMPADQPAVRDVVPAVSFSLQDMHGASLEKLLRQDSSVIWQGLLCLPQLEQQGFLARLPFNAPLTAALEHHMAQGGDDGADRRPCANFLTALEHAGLPVTVTKPALQPHVMAKLASYEELPTLPSIAAQIYAIAADPDSSAADLAEIIANDPALTSKLLKIVNSAFYGSPQQISSVKQAVVLLGMDEIVSIAFGLAASKVFDLKMAACPIDPKQLWRHAVGTALISQHLCRQLPSLRGLGGFTAGLLHDVGKIFLVENFAAQYGEIMAVSRTSALPLYEFEEERFGLNHATIGKALAVAWNLPEPLVQAISHHHQPFTASSHGDFAAVIGLADYLCQRVLLKEADMSSGWLSRGQYEYLTRLHPELTAATLDELTDEVAEMIGQTEGWLLAND